MLIAGICEETIDTNYYCGRFRDSYGLADNGHFYCGACKCDVSVKHLCTPVCQAHMEVTHGSIVSVCFLKDSVEVINER